MGAFTLGVGFSDCNYLAAIVCVTMATAVSGAIATGPLATFVDLSPNFAGKFICYYYIYVLNSTVYVFLIIQ